MKNSKRFMTLALCAFAMTSVNATPKVNGNVLYLYSAADANFEHIEDVAGYDANVAITKIVLDGNFAAGWSTGWLANASSEKAVKVIDMSNAVISGTASWTFANFSRLDEIVWPKSGNITNIPSGAFTNCALKEVHIPGYIQTVQPQAFDELTDNNHLKSVYFEEWDSNGDGVSDVNMHLSSKAFNNTRALADVYISTKGDVTAECNAFPHDDNYGYADPRRMMATLHFPIETAEKYVNMKDQLDEATASDETKFQKWLVSHYSKAGQEHNGFYEFTSSTDYSEIVGEEFLKTYSHPTLAHLVPVGAKAYIVSDFIVDKAKKSVTIKLKSVNVIPAATGVIILGGPNGVNADGKRVLKMAVVNYTGESFSMNNTHGNTNYLTASANVENNPVHVWPTNTDRFGVTYYNFLLGYFGKTLNGAKYYDEHGNYGGESTEHINCDWAGFFRALEGDFASNKAYLHINRDMFQGVNPAEIIVECSAQREPSSAEYYRTEYKDQNMTKFNEPEMQGALYWYRPMYDTGTIKKITWEGLWGVRPGNLSAYLMNDGEISDNDEYVVDGPGSDTSTDISGVKEEKNGNDSYYTLQGVKVTKPGKGVYIHHGKKVILNK